MIVLLDIETDTVLRRFPAMPDAVAIPGTRSNHTRLDGDLPITLPDGTDRYVLVEATVSNAETTADQKLGPEVVTVDGLSVTISRAAVDLTTAEKRAVIDTKLAETDREMARVAEDGITAFDTLIDDLVTARVLTAQQATATKGKIPASVRDKIEARKTLRAGRP